MRPIALLIALMLALLTPALAQAQAYPNFYARQDGCPADGGDNYMFLSEVIPLVDAIPEQPNANAGVFYTTEVANPGAFGWEEGIVISADLFTDGTGTGLLFVWRDGISPPPGIQDVYCRIGTTVTVPASDDGSTPATQKACTDPFAQ